MNLETLTNTVFSPLSTLPVSQSNRLLKRMLVVGHASKKYDPCTEKHSVVYFNQPEVQKALHVIPAVAPAKWETCSGVVNNNWLDSPRTVLDIYHELIHSGLRIWMFSGDTDVVIPVTSTRYSIDGRMDPRVCRTYLCHREGSRPRSPIAETQTCSYTNQKLSIRKVNAMLGTSQPQ